MADTQRRTTKALRRCKACRSCRERKIKCDGQQLGQQPSCSFCRQQGQICSYTEDKRQTSRVTKDTINTVSYKIASLEVLVKQLQDADHGRGQGQYRLMTPEPSSLFDPLPPSTTRTAPSCRENAHDNLIPDTSPVANDNNTRAFNSRRVCSTQRVRDAGRVNETIPSPSSLSTAGPAIVHEPGSVESSHDDEATIVSGLHMRVSNAVHGPTSAFHYRTFSPVTSKHASDSPTSSANPHSRPQPDETNEEDVRARLFMYSALEKQKVFTYMTQRNYDFDGLDYDNAMHLLNLHWNHQHLAYLITYRPAIMNSLATDGPYSSKLLLNAIFYTSAKNSDRVSLRENPADPQTSGDRFLTRFKELLLPELEKSTLPNAAAMLHVGSTLLATGHQTAGWLYSGLGYRMIIDLGLHVDTDKIRSSGNSNNAIDGCMSSIDVEVQRRMFWGAYVNDKFQSLYLGRSPALPATGVEPSQLYLDTFEEMELWSPYNDPQDMKPLLSNFSPRPTYAVSGFKYLLQLAELSSEITTHLYMPAVSKMTSSRALEHLSRLQYKLDKWQQELPVHLQYEPEKDSPPPAHHFNLHTTYHTLYILLHSPFLPGGHLQHFGLNEHATREICISAALKIYSLAKAYRNAFTLRRAPYLFSYALFSAATVIPTHNTPEWNHLARTDMTVFFWDALTELQRGSNFGLRRPMQIIRNFMERAGIDVNNLTTRPDGASGSQPPLEALSLDGEFGCPVAQFPNNITLTLDDRTLTFPDMNLDWLDCTIDPSRDESDNILYGLFTS